MEDSPSKARNKSVFRELTTNLSKEELIRRLKKAHACLAKIEQTEKTELYDAFAASLVTSYILRHREKDVRSYAACCITDIMRIYAPSPPYNEDQLKDIFRLLLEQLKCLEISNIQGPAFKRHVYVLESLALIHTFNMCVEIQDTQDLILDIFKIFFAVVNKKHEVRITNCMLDVLCPLITEVDSLQPEILNLILVHLLEPKKTKRPEANKLACELLDRCASAIEPYVQLFFNNVFVLGTPVHADLDKHVYDLLLELYKINQNVLLSALPQLEFKLKCNEEVERINAVKLLGRLFVEESSTLAENNKALWNCFLGRFLDVSAEVRIECVQLSKNFLTSPILKLRSDVTEQLLQRFHDPDEKVRYETVMTVCEAAAQNIDFVNEKLMDAVKERMRDKKWAIRNEALMCVGKLYKNMLLSGKANFKRISWAPSKILSLYQNSIEDRLCIERVVHGCLIPVTLDADARMKQLYNIYYSLDDIALNIFDSMLKRRAKVNEEFRDLLDLYRNTKVEAKEKKILAKTVSLARCLPDAYRSQEHLKRLLALCSDNHFYDLLRISTDSMQGCSTITDAVKEIVKVIKTKPKNVIKDTVLALLDRACLVLVDMPSFVILLKEIKKDIDGFDDEDDDEQDEYDIFQKGKCGLKLVMTLAAVQPSIFKTKDCFEAFLLFIKNTDHQIVELTLKILLHVISDLEEIDKDLCSFYQPILSKLVTNGTCKQAKYALRCLNKMMKGSNVVMEKIYKTLLDNLNKDTESSRLRTTIAALGEFAMLFPTLFEFKRKHIITDFIVKQILLIDKGEISNSKNSSKDMDEISEVSERTLEKIESIKLLTHWLLGLQSGHPEKAEPVFRLLTTMLEHDGDLSNKGNVSVANRSHLRLAASLAMLKLVQNVSYVDVIKLSQYQQLAFVMQDSCLSVRDKFTRKLHTALDSLRLSLDYLAIFVLAAKEPNKEHKSMVKQMISKNVQTRKEYSKHHTAVAARPYAILPEYSLPYVIHLLAHYPDFQHTNISCLHDTKEYLWFFLEPVLGVRAENYSFLKKLLENVKQTRDKQDPDNQETNEKLYAVCDLAIDCIMNKTHTFTLKEFPGNLVLPKKLFTADKNLHNTKSYLPKGFILSPKKQKAAIDFKIVPNKSNRDRTTETSTKRLSTASDDEAETESPRKRTRASSSSKKKTATTSHADVKKVTRNLEKTKDIASPVVKKNSSKSPLKKSPSKSLRSSKSITPSPSKKYPLRTNKKQLKIESFMNGSTEVDIVEVTTEDYNLDEVLDERPRLSARKSPKKKPNPLKLTTSKRLADEESNASSEDVPLNELVNGNSPKKSVTVPSEEKPSQLKIRRKATRRR